MVKDLQMPKFKVVRFEQNQRYHVELGKRIPAQLERVKTESVCESYSKSKFSRQTPSQSQWAVNDQRATKVNINVATDWMMTRH